MAEIDAAGAALTLAGSWGIDQTARDTLPTQVGAMYVLALTVDGHGLPDQQAVAQTAARWVADAWIARHSVMSRRVPGQIWMRVLLVSVAVIAFRRFFGRADHAMHDAMGAVIAIIPGAVPLVALKLALPFVGQPAPLDAPCVARVQLSCRCAATLQRRRQR